MADGSKVRDEMLADLDERGLTVEEKARATTFLDWCLSREHYVIPADSNEVADG